ncbi:MAG: hypothetical protein MJZ61_10025 [Bacteroidales bacterium]|nr:hypothetical protein [Bacteroidales bacterium]
MEKNSNIQCPDFSVLEKLVAGNLNLGEAIQIQNHISECKDCRDIMEALMEYGPKFDSQAEQRINARIDSRVASIRPKGHVVRLIAKYAAAASILGIGAWSLYHFGADSANTPSTDMALEEGLIPQKEIVAQPDTPPVSDEDKSEESVPITDKPSEKEPEEVSTSILMNAQNNLVARGVEKRKAEQQTQPLAEPVQEPAQSIDDNEEEARGFSGLSRGLDNTTNAELEQLITMAIGQVSQQQYEQAKELLESVIEKGGSSSLVLKNLGICNMNLGLKRRAIDNFKHVKPANDAEAQEIQELINKCKE